MFKPILAAYVAALCLSQYTVVAVPQDHHARAAAAGVCSSGIYGELSQLSRYPPAVSFCSQKFPVQCTSTKAKRLASTTRSTSALPTTSVDAQASAYSKCLKQPASVISTLCSCIQTPKTCSTTKSTTKSTTRSVTKTTTKSTTASTTTSSSKATPTTCSPAQSNFCTSQTQELCFCQLDVDGATPVCSNGSACPQSNFPNPPPPCASDADCSLYFPGSVYNRCVYTDRPDYCSPTYCATEQGCNQQGRAGVRLLQ